MKIEILKPAHFTLLGFGQVGDEEERKFRLERAHKREWDRQNMGEVRGSGCKLEKLLGLEEKMVWLSVCLLM